MPLKLNVGLSRKIGLPNYSSLGASCHVELELDSALLHSNRDAFQQQVRHAFSACQQAVHEQLAQNDTRAPETDPRGIIVSPRESHAAAPPADARANRPQGRMRPATDSQVRAVQAIASQQQVDLPSLLAERFGVAQPEELSVGDASNLIDELNARAAAPSRPRSAG